MKSIRTGFRKFVKPWYYSIKTSCRPDGIRQYRTAIGFIIDAIEDNSDDITEVKITFTNERPSPQKKWVNNEKKTLGEFIEELIKWAEKVDK